MGLDAKELSSLSWGPETGVSCVVCGEDRVIHLHHINETQVIPLCPNHHYLHHYYHVPLPEVQGTWSKGISSGPRSHEGRLALVRLKERVRSLLDPGHPVRVLVDGEPDELEVKEAWWLFLRMIRLAMNFPDSHWPPRMLERLHASDGQEHLSGGDASNPGGRA